MMIALSVTDQIYTEIKDRITSMKFKFGERIDPKKLAKEFGVSQTPIRFALNKLESVGLIEIRPRGGFFVISLTEKDIQEIYDLREMFEVHALKSAIKNLDVGELEQLKREMESIPRIKDPKKKRETLLTTDEKLHLLIINRSDNKRAKDLFVQIFEIVKLSIFMGLEWEPPWQEHIILIDNLIKKDLSTAEQILRKHIRDSKHSSIEQLKAIKRKNGRAHIVS